MDELTFAGFEPISSPTHLSPRESHRQQTHGITHRATFETASMAVYHAGNRKVSEDTSITRDTFDRHEIHRIRGRLQDEFDGNCGGESRLASSTMEIYGGAASRNSRTPLVILADCFNFPRSQF